MNDEVVNSCTFRNSQGGNTCKPHCPFVGLIKIFYFRWNVLFLCYFLIFILLLFFFLGVGGGGKKGLIKLLSNSHLHRTILS